MIKHLKVAIFLYLCLFISGCEKDDVSYYSDEFLRSSGITDVEICFESKPIDSENSVWYYGLRKGKEWFALFDKSKKSLVKEWYGKAQSSSELGDLSSFYSCPDPVKFDNNEYLLWYNPFCGRLGDDVIALIHLQEDGTVKYVNDGVCAEMVPHYFIHGKGWLGFADGKRCIYDNYFENIIINDVNMTNFESEHIYTGFQNNRLWIGFLNDSLVITKEYVSDNAFDRDRKIHLGYGEYMEYSIKSVSIGSHIKTKSGIFFIPRYLTTENEYISQDVAVFKDEKIELYKLENKLNGNLLEWYNESILIDYKYVLSKNGEKVCEGDFFRVNYDYNIPVSYKSWMHMNKYGIYMYNIEDGCSWYTLFDTQVPDNSKIEYTLLKQDNSIWTFKRNIVNYDGSKSSVTFEIDIETGKLLYLA